MNRIAGAIRTRGGITVTLALLVSAGAGIFVVRFAPWEDSVTPQQARGHIASFVDDTLARVVPDGNPVPGRADGSTGVCLNRFGGTAEANDLMYSRQITDFDFDAALGDEIVERAERYWRERGLDVYRNDKIPGVTSLSSSADGFGYSFVVNRNEPLIAASAQTPCFSWKEWEEAGLTP